MSLEIQSVADRRSENERLILKVLDDTNTGSYVVMDKTFNNDGDVSNLGRHAFKFPPKEVKRGDFVVLFSRLQGTSPLQAPNQGGSGITHFFYWGRASNATVWNNEGDQCTVMKIVHSNVV